MSKEVARASWNSTYEKGLVDILHDHNNNPKFKGQNGWVTEGWKSITSKFNEKFPVAHFTKQQIQEKEKELKSSYKSIRDAKKQSGTGWDDSLGMILAEPKIWAKIIEVVPKVKKFRQKPFPLFNSLALLYEGSIATGDLNFTSAQQLDAPAERSTSEQSIHHMPAASELNEINGVGTNPFASSLDGHETSTEHIEPSEAQSAPTKALKRWQREKAQAKSRCSCSRRICRLQEEPNRKDIGSSG